MQMPGHMLHAPSSLRLALPQASQAVPRLVLFLRNFNPYHAWMVCRSWEHHKASWRPRPGSWPRTRASSCRGMPCSQSGRLPHLSPCMDGVQEPGAPEGELEAKARLMAQDARSKLPQTALYATNSLPHPVFFSKLS